MILSIAAGVALGIVVALPACLVLLSIMERMKVFEWLDRRIAPRLEGTPSGKSPRVKRGKDFDEIALRRLAAAAVGDSGGRGEFDQETVEEVDEFLTLSVGRRAMADLWRELPSRVSPSFGIFDRAYVAAMAVDRIRYARGLPSFSLDVVGRRACLFVHKDGRVGYWRALPDIAAMLEFDLESDEAAEAFRHALAATGLSVPQGHGLAHWSEVYERLDAKYPSSPSPEDVELESLGEEEEAVSVADEDWLSGIGGGFGDMGGSAPGDGPGATAGEAPQAPADEDWPPLVIEPNGRSFSEVWEYLRTVRWRGEGDSPGSDMTLDDRAWFAGLALHRFWKRTLHGCGLYVFDGDAMALWLPHDGAGVGMWRNIPARAAAVEIDFVFDVPGAADAVRRGLLAAGGMAMRAEDISGGGMRPWREVYALFDRPAPPTADPDPGFDPEPPAAVMGIPDEELFAALDGLAEGRVSSGRGAEDAQRSGG